MTNPGSPGRALSPSALDMPVPSMTLMDSFNKTTTFPAQPEIGFGTGSRPPLMVPTTTPGPGAYAIKTTLSKTVDSTIRSPMQFTIRSRQKFGDPNLRALSKATASEPGPGQYDYNGRFLSGHNPEKYSFPKARQPQSKAQLAPGPGAYAVTGSMGKQVLSNKHRSMEPAFPQAARPTLVAPGTTDIGPGEYGVPPAACETQVDSRKTSCAMVKFGGGYQKNKNKVQKVDLSEPSPGPGSYVLPGGVATKAAGTPYRSSPAATISGRNAFGSPW